MPEPIDALRTFLAALVALAALGALNKMHHRQTRPCLAAAMLLLVVGGGGHAIAALRSEFTAVLDVMLYGGIVSLLLATQRTSTWFLERWANPAASIVAVIAFVVGIGWALTRPAHAQDAPSSASVVEVKCAGLANLVERAATYRDVDANLAKFLAWVERLSGAASEEQRAVIRREVRRLWAEKKPGTEAAFAVYRRCVANLGDMGRES